MGTGVRKGLLLGPREGLLFVGGRHSLGILSNPLLFLTILLMLTPIVRFGRTTTVTAVF